ncbi:MAG TPA: 50S ribosomal protein L15 [Patescibacteria group bacterium]|nr:50S ribosomal protein L15 [Patescibacteria group bacterium]
MKFHDLKMSSNRSAKRVGRGIAAGQGKTAGRGTKGQNSRGSGTRPGFEGGQSPLLQRLPKLRGFRSARTKPEVVYTGQLNDLGATIDNFKLAEAGLVTNPYTKVRLVLKGEVTKKLDVHLQGASESALSMIQKAGGSFKVTPQVGREKVKKPVAS